MPSAPRVILCTSNKYLQGLLDEIQKFQKVCSLPLDFSLIKRSRIPTSKTQWCLQLHKGNIIVFGVCVIIWVRNYQLHFVSTSEEHLILIENPSINPPAVWVRQSPTEQRKGLKISFCGDKTGIRTFKKLSSGAVVKCLCDQKCTFI